MPEPFVALAHRILEKTDTLLTPQVTRFSAAVVDIAGQVGALLNAPSVQGFGLSALNLAFSLTRGQPRRRQCLELCAWEFFGCPAVQGEESAPLRALDLVSLPFLLEFDPSRIVGPLFLQQVEVPIDHLVAQAQAEGLLPLDRYFGGFDVLLTREDLHAWGPQRISEAFVAADAGDEIEPLTALPLFLDSEIESGCCALVMVPLAASVFPGMPKIPRLAGHPTAAQTADLIHQALVQAGLPVESTRALAPVALGEMLRRTSGPAALEMAAWLARAKSLYAIESVSLEEQGGGRAELRGRTGQGVELVLASPFQFVEPIGEIDQWIRTLCQTQNLAYTGTLISAVPLSELVH